MRPEPGAGLKPTKRRKADAPTSDKEGSDTEHKSKKTKKSRPTPKPKVNETKANKVSMREAKKSGVKSRASGNKPVISAVSSLVNAVSYTY